MQGLLIRPYPIIRWLVASRFALVLAASLELVLASLAFQLMHSTFWIAFLLDAAVHGVIALLIIYIRQLIALVFAVFLKYQMVQLAFRLAHDTYWIAVLLYIAMHVVLWLLIAGINLIDAQIRRASMADDPFEVPAEWKGDLTQRYAHWVGRYGALKACLLYLKDLATIRSALLRRQATALVSGVLQRLGLT